tara:strand:- start:222 stop:1196 length:975 start_codon:yes stop_codon:yes gene_type:complete
MILKKSDIFKPGVGIITSPAPLNPNVEIIKSLKNEMKKKDDKIYHLEKMLRREQNLKENKKNKKYQNTLNFDIIFKILHKVLNYNNVKEFSLYGSFVKNLLSGKLLDNSQLNIFIKDHEDMEEYYGLLEIIYQEDCISNINDFDNICYYSLGEKNIPFWNLEIKLTNNKTCNLRIHGCDYMREVSNSASNIEINQNGINNIYRMEREMMDSNISGLNILKVLRNTINSETKMYKRNNINKNLLENQPELFSILFSQTKYINNKWKIANGFHCIRDDCSVCLEKKIVYELECHHFFCADCLHSHITNDSDVNKCCPLCRRDIKLH